MGGRRFEEKTEKDDRGVNNGSMVEVKRWNELWVSRDALIDIISNARGHGLYLSTSPGGSVAEGNISPWRSPSAGVAVESFYL